MKKSVLVLFLVFMAACLMAQTASIGSVSGKVEIQEPGSVWKTAVEGMNVATLSKISTGFASEARIVMDNANITVRPLTRMTLEEYSSVNKTTTTKLFLGSGRIRTDVKKSKSRINDFQVRSPVATAAVRGTAFDFDGVRLTVTEGNVDFFSQSGNKVSVPAGSASVATEESGPVAPAEQKQQETAVAVATSTGEEAAVTSPAKKKEETLVTAKVAEAGLKKEPRIAAVSTLTVAVK